MISTCAGSGLKSGETVFQFLALSGYMIGVADHIGRRVGNQQNHLQPLRRAHSQE
jgi:hypothetical protein